MNTTKKLTGFPERLLKAEEIANILNISRAYAYELIQKGKIRTVKIGTSRRVRPQDLREYIAENIYPPILDEFIWK